MASYFDDLALKFTTKFMVGALAKMLSTISFIVTHITPYFTHTHTHTHTHTTKTEIAFQIEMPKEVYLH